MKKFILLFPFFVLLSCSVQKRKYQDGFYISWKNRSDKAVAAREQKQEPLKIVAIEKPKEQIVPFERKDKLLASAASPAPLFRKDEPLCDDLIFRDGSEVRGKVLEISSTEIKYKRCDMLEGPTYTVRKSDLFMIKYSNGTREVFKSEPATTGPYTPEQKKYRGPVKTHPMAVLSLVFGILGIYPLVGVASIAAVVLGLTAQRRIEREPEKYKGEGLAIAGKVLGIIVLSIIGVILLLVLLAFLLFA